MTKPLDVFKSLALAAMDAAEALEEAAEATDDLFSNDNPNREEQR